MTQYYVDPGDWTSDPITLSLAESHHLLHVLRKPVGSSISISDGRGHVGTAEVIKIENKRSIIHVTQRRSISVPSFCIMLAQALLKTQKMEWFIQKATEIGVRSIFPVQAEHCVVRFHASQLDQKRKRWEKVALHAAKQCHSDWIPCIEPITPLSHFLDKVPEGMLWMVGSLSPNAIPFQDALFHEAFGHVSGIGMLVGPEGDFSSSEQEQIQKKGLVSVSFGQNILRAETAALYALSIISHHFSMHSAERRSF